MSNIYDIVDHLTVPSADNGRVFIQMDRLLRIQSDLKESEYSLFDSMPLAYIYHSQSYSSQKPSILISAHIDSVYSAYITQRGGEEIIGTFDNSACNAVALHLMLNQRLPSQVLVAFTGNEERKCLGVNQVIQILQSKEPAYSNLELVITLDLTEEAFGQADFTIENYFIKKQNADSLLRFSRKRELKDYLMAVFENTPFIKDADPDESWQYKKYDLNCFSLCLPCRILGKDMHDDCGVAIRSKSFVQYAEALEMCAWKLCNDLEQSTISTTR